MYNLKDDHIKSNSIFLEGTEVIKPKIKGHKKTKHKKSLIPMSKSYYNLQDPHVESILQENYIIDIDINDETE